MKLLVTGREGQLVRSLIERAEDSAEIEIVALGRPALDLEQRGSAERAVARIAPDLVITAAAYTAVDKAEDAPERAWRVTDEAPGALARAAAGIGAPIIQISTDYVFDGASSRPYREEDPTGPVGVYGRTKLAGEEAVRAAATDHLILRTAWVYSPFGANFVKTMMRLAGDREQVNVVADQIGNPSSALDLADGLLRVVEQWREGGRQGVGNTYHLAGNGEASWADFASAIFDSCRALGLAAADVAPIRTADWPTRARRPANSRLDCSAFARDFGFTMPDWRPSTRKVVERLAEAARLSTPASPR